MTQTVARVALIGFGAMGREVARILGMHPDRVRLEAVLVRSSVHPGPPLRFVSTLDELLETRPSLVFECAGHGAVRDYGPHVLESGASLVIASVGALADARLEARLREAERPGARLIVPSGAVGGLDALQSARLAGLERVLYTSRKPSRAWVGTPAEKLVPLGELSQPTVFFEGSARDAARLYPQNANVAASIALAGLGFDHTLVRQVADPNAHHNTHEIEAEGAFGRARFWLEGIALPGNPKTSMLAPASLARIALEDAEINRAQG